MTGTPQEFQVHYNDSVIKTNLQPEKMFHLMARGGDGGKGGDGGRGGNGGKG